MNIRHLGTNYGGWTIDLDSINDGDIIIDAGLGEDISFDLKLNEIKKIKIIGIDPTPKSHNYIQNLNIENLELIKKAIDVEDKKIIKMYKNSNPDWVSESSHIDHLNVSENSFYEVETISLKSLIKNYNPSLVKLDIEGTEYDVLEQCIGVKQICVEFHHKQLKNRDINDTLNLITIMENNGYQKLHTTSDYQEVTFLLV
jgi:FkbM family methyltransferase